MLFDIDTLSWRYQTATFTSDGNSLGMFEPVSYNELRAAMSIFLQSRIPVEPPSGWLDVLAVLNNHYDQAGLINYPRFVKTPSGQLVDLKDKAVLTNNLERNLFNTYIGAQLQSNTSGNLFFSNTSQPNTTNPFLATVTFSNVFTPVGEWKSLPSSGYILRYQYDHTSGVIHQFLDGTLIDSIAPIDGVDPTLDYDVTNQSAYLLPSQITNWAGTRTLFSSRYGMSVQCLNTALTSGLTGAYSDVPVMVHVSGYLSKPTPGPCSNPSCDHGFDTSEGVMCLTCWGAGYDGLSVGNYQLSHAPPNTYLYVGSGDAYLNQGINAVGGQFPGNAYMLLSANDRLVPGTAGATIPGVTTLAANDTRSLRQCRRPVDVSTLRWFYETLWGEYDNFKPGTLNASFEDLAGVSQADVTSMLDSITKFNYNNPASGSQWPASIINFTPIQRKHFEPLVNGLTRGYLFFYDETNDVAVVNDYVASYKTGSPVEWAYHLSPSGCKWIVKGFNNVLTFGGSSVDLPDFSIENEVAYPGFVKMQEGYGNESSITRLFDLNNVSTLQFLLTDIVEPLSTSATIFGGILQNGVFFTQMFNGVPTVSGFTNGNSGFTNLCGGKLHQKTLLIKSDEIHVVGSSGIALSIPASGIQDLVPLCPPPKNIASSEFNPKHIWIGKFNNDLHVCRLRSGVCIALHRGPNYSTGAPNVLSRFRFHYGDGLNTANIGNHSPVYEVSTDTLDLNDAVQINSLFNVVSTDKYANGTYIVHALGYDTSSETLWLCANDGVWVISTDLLNRRFIPWDADSWDLVLSYKSSVTSTTERVQLSIFSFSGDVYLYAFYETPIRRKFFILEEIDGVITVAEVARPYSLGITDEKRIKNNPAMDTITIERTGTLSIVNSSMTVVRQSSTAVSFNSLCMNPLEAITFVTPGDVTSVIDNSFVIQLSDAVELEKGALIPTDYSPSMLIPRSDSFRNILPFFGKCYAYATDDYVINRTIPDNHIVGKSEHRTGSDIVSLHMTANNNGAWPPLNASAKLITTTSYAPVGARFLNAVSNAANSYVEVGVGDKQHTYRGLMNYWASGLNSSSSPTLYMSDIAFSPVQLREGENPSSVAATVRKTGVNELSLSYNDSQFQAIVPYAGWVYPSIFLDKDAIALNPNHQFGDAVRTFYMVPSGTFLGSGIVSVTKGFATTSSRVVLMEPSGQTQTSASTHVPYIDLGTEWPYLNHAQDLSPGLPMRVSHAPTSFTDSYSEYFQSKSIVRSEVLRHPLTSLNLLDPPMLPSGDPDLDQGVTANYAFNLNCVQLDGSNTIFANNRFSTPGYTIPNFMCIDRHFVWSLGASNRLQAYNPFTGGVQTGVYYDIPESGNIYAVSCPAGFYSLDKNYDKSYIESIARVSTRDKSFCTTTSGPGICRKIRADYYYSHDSVIPSSSGFIIVGNEWSYNLETSGFLRGYNSVTGQTVVRDFNTYGPVSGLTNCHLAMANDGVIAFTSTDSHSLVNRMGFYDTTDDTLSFATASGTTSIKCLASDLDICCFENGPGVNASGMYVYRNPSDTVLYSFHNPLAGSMVNASLNTQYATRDVPKSNFVTKKDGVEYFFDGRAVVSDGMMPYVIMSPFYTPIWSDKIGFY